MEYNIMMLCACLNKTKSIATVVRITSIAQAHYFFNKKHKFRWLILFWRKNTICLVIYLLLVHQYQGTFYCHLGVERSLYYQLLYLHLDIIQKASLSAEKVFTKYV